MDLHGSRSPGVEGVKLLAHRLGRPLKFSKTYNKGKQMRAAQPPKLIYSMNAIFPRSLPAPTEGVTYNIVFTPYVG